VDRVVSLGVCPQWDEVAAPDDDGVVGDRPEACGQWRCSAIAGSR
jgi:hypothetical protein